jgi:hypothetical protein
MSIPEIGTVLGTDFFYMYALDSSGTVYSGILVQEQGVPLPRFIMDPRLPAGSMVNFTSFSSYSQMTVRSGLGAIIYSIGYTNGSLDVTASPSNIVPITTEANDDYWPSNNVTSLTGIAYDFFYNNLVVPFNAYVSDGKGGIKTDSSGNPLIQSLYGKFYFFTITWYPISNCSVTLSDQSTINSIVKNWLITGAMPSSQYFTNSADCQTANAYNYCPYRTTCTSTCNGPCVSPDQECILNTSNKQYYCSGNTNTTDLTPYYVVIALLLVMLVAFLILIFLK